ncbi:hypothetical protein GN156_16760 [bacterium LRH843]|nr:hypothetical protein [bacterium LRH843]
MTKQNFQVQSSKNSVIPQSGMIGTDPAKVKQEIATDVARGEGAMTAREAGHMRSED